MDNKLSQIDLVFCVDLTNSMTPFIQAAQRQMVDLLSALRQQAQADLRVAVIGYRDHGRSEALEVHAFSKDVGAVQIVLQGLKTGSGSDNLDAAEAVFAGVGACLGLPWRDGAFRVMVLVGDGPPHACGADAQPFPDRFPDKDPTGYTLDDLANRLEGNGIFTHALAMIPSSIPQHDEVLEKSFRRLSVSTGGSYQVARQGQAAMAVFEAIAKRVFGQLEFDRRLFAALESVPAPSSQARAMAPSMAASGAGRSMAEPASRMPGAPPASAPAAPAMSADMAIPSRKEQLSKTLGVSEEEVAASLVRLRQRKLLDEDEDK
jgi:hypothetical protein